MSFSHKRTFVKGLTWECSGLIILFLIAYFILHEALTASIFSIGYTVGRVIMYYIHERIWKKTSWLKPPLNENENEKDDE